jgi:hypothetical protein
VSSIARWSVDNVARIIAKLESPRPVSAPTVSRDERYHGPAAVVTRFEIDRATHQELVAATNLIMDSELVDGAESRQRWSLKDDVRKRILAQLGTKEALQRALEEATNRPEDDVVQRVLETWINGIPTPVDRQSADELSATLQVAEWLEATELEPELPDKDDLRRRVELESLLRPFRALVGSHFRGRGRELAVLADYVDAAIDVSSEEPHRPMLIHGPGGMGKSTLVAKFLLSRLEAGTAAFIYLDCDRPGLVAEEPLTLLAEAVRQLGLQSAELSGSAQRLRASWMTELSRTRENVSSDLESVALESLATRDRSKYLTRFSLFARALRAGQPVLLVIDTFEELQYRSKEFVGELLRFLGELQRILPQTRIIISGRDELAGFEVEALPLTQLDVEAAEGFLEARGVTAPDTRRALARALHGNPLSLRLATTLMSSAALSSVELRGLGKIVDDTEIQGILYRRILSHLHEKDPVLERIAHPGLILRRITADLIQVVIAPACGVEISEERAGALMTHLRREMALVTSEGEAVRHRPDVRRVMLGPLLADPNQRQQAHDIQTNAVAYYAQFDDPASRAEEIYHRLMLQQGVTEIEPRWLSGQIEDYLRGAVDDLPKASRSYLASRLGIDLHEDLEEVREPLVWERLATKRAEDLIRLDRPEEALPIVQARSWRSPGSPLYWLEARLLRALGRNREARQVARTGIGSLPVEQLTREHFDLAVLLAECDEILGGEIDWDSVVAIARHFIQLVPGLSADRYPLAYIRRLSKTSNTIPEPAQAHELREITNDYLYSLPIPEAFEDIAEALASNVRQSPEPPKGLHPVESFAAHSRATVELLGALTDALPGDSDPYVLADELGASDQIDFNVESAQLMPNLLSWAERQGRLADLVSTAARLNPKAVPLREWLSDHATRLESQPVDPFSAVLLPGGRPFLDRKRFRDIMRRQSFTGAPRVIRIDGPPGSGKSYTREYLEYLASSTGAFRVGAFSLNWHWSLEDLVGSIHGRFEWRWDRVDRSLPEAALCRAYVDQIIHRTRRSEETTVLFIDRERQVLQPRVISFLETLAQQLFEERARILLILVDLDEAASDPRIVRDSLGLLTAADVMDGLEALPAAPRVDRGRVEQMVNEFSMGPPMEEFSASVGNLFAGFAAEASSSAVPVEVYVVAHAGDSRERDEVINVLESVAGVSVEGTKRALVPSADYRYESMQNLARAEIVLLVLTGNRGADELPLKGADLERILNRQDKGRMAVLGITYDLQKTQNVDVRIPQFEVTTLVPVIEDAVDEARRRREKRVLAAFPMATLGTVRGGDIDNDP